MSDNSEVLTAIDSLTKMVEAKHDHLDDKLERSQKDISRNQTSIEKLFNLDRKQSEEIAAASTARMACEQKSTEERGKIRAEMQPVIQAAKNMRKGMWTMITAALAAVGAGVGAFFLKLFERGGS